MDGTRVKDLEEEVETTMVGIITEEPTKAEDTVKGVTMGIIRCNKCVK